MAPADRPNNPPRVTKGGLGETARAKRSVRPRAEPQAPAERPPAWIVYGKGERAEGDWRDGIQPGRLMFWQHGRVRYSRGGAAYSRTLQRGDTAFVLLNQQIVAVAVMAADGDLAFEGLGEDGEGSNDRWWPIKFVDVYEPPISRRRIEAELGHNLIVTQGGIHRVDERAFRLIAEFARQRAPTRLPIPSETAEQALAAGEQLNDLLARTRDIVPTNETNAKLRLTGGGEVPTTPDRVTPFSNDAVSAADDVLGVGRDAHAIAQLMCLDSASPLAIAVLGGWGSGKSTFMDLLDQEVREITERERALLRPTADGQPRLVRNVVPIRFNAWQFVDANLWASLTAEFFDQLRAGGWDRTGEARHAELVAEVNAHVHALNADLEQKRRAIAATGHDVLLAQQARDRAARAVDGAGDKVMGQAAIDLLADLYQSQKQNLSQLGMAVTGTDTSAAVDTILKTVSRSRTIGGQALAVAMALRKSPGRMLLLVTGLLLIAAAVSAAFLVPQLAWSVVARLLAAVGGLGAAAAAALPAIRLVGAATAKAAAIAHAVGEADEQAMKALLASEMKLREATREAEARRAAAEQAQRSLARYVDPSGAPNPPRLLRYVLEDDPDTKALEHELGLISRTRRLFQAVDEIVRRERGAPDVPDRIVLYIDDLDRCTEEQVYNVLQAIHLLLAFSTFVVVVGVDVDWVERALARTTDEADEGGKDVLSRRQRAARYLEKIFQVAFWLKPLSSGEGETDSYGRYMRSLASTAAAKDESDVATKQDESGGIADNGEDKPESGTGAGTPDEASAEDLETAKTETTTDAATSEAEPEPEADLPPLAAIQLEPPEVVFLASPVMAGLAAGTPRSAKRLVNIYRLLRARLTDDGVSILGGGGEPPAYPLIALLTALETNQPVEVAEAFHAGLKGLAADDDLVGLETLPGSGPNATEVTKQIAHALRLCPGLKVAVEEVARLREGKLTAGEALKVALVARRYSFNRGG